MTAKQLKNSILQMGVQGKLLPQNPDDEPASVLLEKIRQQKQRLVEEGKIKKPKAESVILRGSDKIPGTEAGRFYEKIGNGELLDITEKLPFDIPESWEWVKLGNIINLQSGKFASAKDIKKDYELGLYPCYGGNGIRGYIQKYNCDGSFFIIGRVGALCGNVHFCEGKFYVTDNAIIAYPFTEIEVEWLKFILTNNIKSFSNATAQPVIASSLISKIPFPLPPLAEQKRIAARLEEILPKIEEYQQTEEKITQLNVSFPDSFKKSVLQYAIQGKLVPQDPADEPASVLLEKIRRERARLVKEGKIRKPKRESFIFRRDGSWWEKTGKEERCIEKEIPFEIPNSWEWARLGEIVYNHGQIIPTSTFCYIDIGSIDNKNQRLSSYETILQASEAPSRARKIVYRGDIIYSTVRPYLHNTCIIDKEFSHIPIASTGFAVLACLSGIHNKFLFNFLLSPSFDKYANHNENSKGVAYPAINDERLYRALIPIPPTNEQKHISNKVAQFIELYNIYNNILNYKIDSI